MISNALKQEISACTVVEEFSKSCGFESLHSIRRDCWRYYIDSTIWRVVLGHI